MDFSLSTDQAALVEAATMFASKRLAPNAAKWDREATFPRDVIQEAAELGFLGLYTPEKSGGLGLSRLDSCLIFESLAMGCTSTTAYLSIHNMVTWMVGEFGDSTELDTIAQQLAVGELLGSYCLTEPNAGSDAASLQTSAKAIDGGFEITGSKAFISAAGDSDILVVMAKEDNQSISAFVIPATSKGITFGRKEPKMGWNSQATRAVNLERVFVPLNHRLGEGGDGFAMAMKGLDGGRINIAACSLGTAQQAINKTRDYVQERQQFGKLLADFQAVQFKLADMVTELESARWLLYRAAWTLDNQLAGKARSQAQSTSECAMAKRLVTDVSFEICNQAMQLFGGYGYIKEYPLERYFRDARVHQILEGTNEIMRVIIARHIFSEHYDARILEEI